MNKGFRLVTMVALSLVLLAGVSLVGCGEDEELEPLQDLDMSLYQYLKGATVDMDDAMINSAAEGGGEDGANSMGMGYSAALAGLLPPCKEYANLTAAQKEDVSAWVVGFLGQVDDGLAAYANGTATLQDNLAYTFLHGLSGAAWFGKWSKGAWPAKQAFWVAWATSSVGGDCVFADYVALNGLADVTGNDAYTWAGGALTYAEQTVENRDLIDADLAAFYATMETECTAAAVTAGATDWLMDNAFDEMMEAVAAAGTAPDAATMGPKFMAAYQAYLGTNYPLVYQGMVDASFAVAMATEAWPVIYTLGKVGADGWAADVDLGVHPRQAFFRWIAKPALLALAGMGVMVELSVGEFSFKITNPNEYFVSIDNMSINISANADGSSAFGAAIFPALDVDAAKLAIGDKMWIPPAKDGVDGEVIVKLSAPIKWLDMVTWLVMAGYDGDTAGGYSMDVWAQMHLLGTVVWDVTVEATISSEEETITQSFDLTWTPAA